jgi:hypothetical protein
VVESGDLEADVQFGESRDDANADAEPAAHSDHAMDANAAEDKEEGDPAPAGALAALMFSGNVLTCVGQLMEPQPVQQSLVLQQKVMQLFRITMQIVLPRPVLVLNKAWNKNDLRFFRRVTHCNPFAEGAKSLTTGTWQAVRCCTIVLFG